MTSNTSALQAEPALRIPTVDSMKHLSAATEFSDMPDFNFTTSSDDEPLVLPTYLLEQIDIGQRQVSGAGSSNESLERANCHVTRLESILDGSQDQVNRASCSEGQNQHTTDHMAFANRYPVPVRRSSLTVPFNQPRPPSQLTTRTEGITALPTVSSRGSLSNPQCIVGSSTPIAAIGHKRTLSFSFSAPIKRLRASSITAKFKGHARRSSSLSCMNMEQDAGADKNGKIKSGPKSLNLSIEPDCPAPMPSATFSTTPTITLPATPTSAVSATARSSNSNTNKNSPATTLIPTYPPPSRLHSPTHNSAPAEVLLPSDSDLTCLPALQDLISTLNDENEKLKQQVKVLREDWYATHDELLLERYKAWEKECELETLKVGQQSGTGTGDRGTRVQGRSGMGKVDVLNEDVRVGRAGEVQVKSEDRDEEMFSWARINEAVGVAR